MPNRISWEKWKPTWGNSFVGLVEKQLILWGVRPFMCLHLHPTSSFRLLQPVVFENSKLECFVGTQNATCTFIWFQEGNRYLCLDLASSSQKKPSEYPWPVSSGASHASRTVGHVSPFSLATKAGHQQIVDANVFQIPAVLPWCYADCSTPGNDSLVAFGHQDSFCHPPKFPSLDPFNTHQQKGWCVFNWHTTGCLGWWSGVGGKAFSSYDFFSLFSSSCHNFETKNIWCWSFLSIHNFEFIIAKIAWYRNWNHIGVEFMPKSCWIHVDFMLISCSSRISLLSSCKIHAGFIFTISQCFVQCLKSDWC